ncbi:MAG: hypothetical protein IKK29_02745, partial [Christensenellaceae bacterium]|nr:hypothetical protein [Christensenellaceae bacterium]
MKRFLAVLLAILLMLSFAACGNDKTAVDYNESVEGALVVAEAGSAGEELATGEEFFANAEF